MKTIKILTDDDVTQFNHEAPKHEIVIAGFFMAQCPACVAFKPEWKQFVKSCEKNKNPNILIAEVDSNQAGKVDFDTSGLDGFPTVLMKKKGSGGVEEFKDERNAEGLKRFLEKALSTPTKKGGKRKRSRQTRKRKKRRLMKLKRKRKRTVRRSKRVYVHSRKTKRKYNRKY